MEDGHGYGGLRSLRSSSIDSNETVFSDSETKISPRQRAVNQPCARPLCWTICSATALYSTKRLLVNHNYHYPATIAFRTFGAILLAYTIALLLSTESPQTDNGDLSCYRLRRPSWLQILPNQTWKSMLPVSLMAAASLPMLFQGLLHMPSLPALVMLFPIISATETLVLFLYHASQPPRKQYQPYTPPWWAFGAISASIILLYNEYRLMVPGLVWGITGLLTIGVVRALFVIESWHEFEIEARLQRIHGFIIMTLLSGLVVSSAIAYLFESPAGLHVPYPTLGMMFVNIVTLTGTTFTGTSLLAYSPISVLNAKPVYSTKFGRGTENLTSFASSLLVLVTTLCSQPATVVSWAQILMYLLATFCVLRSSEAHATIVEVMEPNQQVFRICYKSSRIGTPRKVFHIGIASFVFVPFAVVLFVLVSVSLAPASTQNSTLLDSNYNATSSFDIVVSAYLEEPELIKSMIDSLRKTAYLKNLRPNVILYTKDPEANVAALTHATSATVVKSLENLGREGGTYLYHIVTNWDSLAEKTMFIQAHAHNMREILPRIDDYLVADTGMLSLGFTGVRCSCLDCQDRWGWKDYDNVIPTLYQQIYNQTCDSNTPILLSYKGQFVVSAKRIRGISKSLYERLLLAVTTTEARGYNRDIGYEQSLDNPFFGFTMERIWGLVMQCATDGRVAARCPSLLSGKGLGGDVRDCQCLDP